MSETRLIGVSSIGIGDIAVDGDVATTFAALGHTYKDTAEITQTQDADTEHMCEESDEPFEIIPGAKKTTLKWAITDATPETLVKVLGGTVTGTGETKAWEAPAVTEVIEKSVKITPKSGKPITCPRVSLKATIDYKLQRNGIFKVNVEGRVLTPTKTAVAALRIG